MKAKKRKAPWPKFISAYSLKRGCPIHLVVECFLDLSVLNQSHMYWVFLRTHQGWRWTLFSSNGRIVGAATEDFASKFKAVKNAAFHGCPLWCRRRPWPDGMYCDVVSPSWNWGTARVTLRDYDAGLQYVR